MIDYNYVVRKAEKRLAKEYSEIELVSRTRNRMPASITGFQTMLKRDELSETTINIYNRVNAEVEKGNSRILEGRRRNLPNKEIMRIIDDAMVKIVTATEAAKTAIIRKQYDNVEKNAKFSRNGDGLNSTEKLVRIEQSKLEIMTMSDQEIMALLADYDKDPYIGTDRTMLQVIAIEKKKYREKALAMLDQLPAGASMSGSMKVSLLEVAGLIEAKLGNFPYLNKEGKRLGEVSAPDLMDTGVIKPTADDILNEK